MKIFNHTMAAIAIMCILNSTALLMSAESSSTSSLSAGDETWEFPAHISNPTFFSKKHHATSSAGSESEASARTAFFPVGSGSDSESSAKTVIILSSSDSGSEDYLEANFRSMKLSSDSGSDSEDPTVVWEAVPLPIPCRTSPTREHTGSYAIRDNMLAMLLAQEYTRPEKDKKP